MNVHTKMSVLVWLSENVFCFPNKCSSVYSMQRVKCKCVGVVCCLPGVDE